MILVVEDNLIHNNTICGTLSDKTKNTEIISCTSIEESLMTNSENPDVIILNYYLNNFLPNAMTGDKGVQLYKRIYPNSKIIVFSGQDSLEKAMQVLEVGADEYIVKNSIFMNKIEDNSLYNLVNKVNLYLN